MLPFNSLFFDSQPLIEARWPIITTKLRTVINFAHRFGVHVFLPEPTERELEEHRLREYEEASFEVTSKLQRLLRKHPYIDPAPKTVDLLDADALRATYRTVVETLKRDWEIETSPLTQRKSEEFFAMAIRQQPPFKREGAGFQDCMIYMSVVDFVREYGLSAAFVTGDGFFGQNKETIQQLAAAEGAQVAIYESLEQIERVFERELGEEITAMLEENRRRVAEKLETMHEKIADFVSKNVQFMGSSRFSGNVLEVRDLHVARIEYVFAGVAKEGEPIDISFDAVLKARLLVEVPAFDIGKLLRLKLGGPPVLEPTQEEIEPEVRVSIEGREIMIEGNYQLELTSAILK